MLAGTAGLVIGSQFGLSGVAAEQRPSPKAKAKAVIQIWMWGGPPHIDTFDPKPAAGSDYCGPLDKPIATNVAGIRICELLPNLAKQADKYSIIRSMTHGIFAHETASYATQTGRMPGDRQVYPGTGAVVSLFRGYDAGYKGLVPPYIVLTEPQGRFSEAGFLGIRYKPFATGGDPSQTRFVVEGVVAQGISDQRQKNRRELLEELNSLKHAAAQRPAAGEPAGFGEAGLRPDPRRRRQGLRPDAGEGRAPRPLRPQQVRAIVPAGPAARRARRALYHDQLPRLGYAQGELPGHAAEAARRWTRACPACLQDLADRGLLESTIVWWGGEFGRKPKVDWDAPWNGGRNHWGKVFSAVVAGGGFKGGQVIGASDAKGEEVKDRPVYPCDVIGSMYELLGIDTEARLPHPLGLVARVTPSPARRRSVGRALERDHVGGPSGSCRVRSSRSKDPPRSTDMDGSSPTSAGLPCPSKRPSLFFHRR